MSYVAPETKEGTNKKDIVVSTLSPSATNGGSGGGGAAHVVERGEGSCQCVIKSLERRVRVAGGLGK